MDILNLVDRLEELLNKSRPLLFTHNVMIDEDRMLDIIDQMRVAVPDEVKKAQQLLAQREQNFGAGSRRSKPDDRDRAGKKRSAC